MNTVTYLHAELAFNRAAKKKIYYGDTLDVLAGCFLLHNWDVFGTAVITLRLLSWASCLTACHRSIDQLVSLSATLYGKWYYTAEQDLHMYC